MLKMMMLLVVCAMFLLAVSASAAEPVEGAYLVAGQIGYITGGEKLAIAASKDDIDWKSVAIVDAKSGKPVFHIPEDGGSLEKVGNRPDVKQFITRIYFGAFNKPGRYYLESESQGVKSYPFNIGDDVFAPLAAAVTKMLYYQRYGQTFDEKNAGRWAGKSYHDTTSALTANVCEWAGGNWLQVGNKVIDNTPRNVLGGWYDAGDPNKYTKNECVMHNALMMTYDINRKYLKDGDENIPESGNKFPDLLDQARFTTEYLLRIEREDGAVFDRVAHGDNPKGPTRIAEPCSGATLCAAGSLAWAAADWKEFDPKFAADCLAGANKAWDYMEAHPSPWPVDANGKPRKIGSIDGGYGDEKALRAEAAAALYRATGDAKYKEIVEPYLSELKNLRLGFNTRQIEICHLYMLTSGANPEIVADFGKKLAGDAASLKNDVSKEAKKHAYGSGNRDGYYWGCNGAIALHASQMAWWAWKFAPDADKPAFAAAADEYLQYETGRNPTRWCYITSLQDIGAEHSVQAMFSFLNRADRWVTPDEAHPDRVGCYPGYVVGGATGSILGFKFDPYKVSGDYEHMEPSIIYQSGLIALANYCAGVAREHRAPLAGTKSN